MKNQQNTRDKIQFKNYYEISKILNLLCNATTQSSKFRTKIRTEVNGDACATYKKLSIQIKNYNVKIEFI